MQYFVFFLFSLAILRVSEMQELMIWTGFVACFLEKPMAFMKAMWISNQLHRPSITVSEPKKDRIIMLFYAGREGINKWKPWTWPSKANKRPEEVSSSQGWQVVSCPSTCVFVTGSGSRLLFHHRLKSLGCSVILCGRAGFGIRHNSILGNGGHRSNCGTTWVHKVECHPGVETVEEQKKRRVRYCWLSSSSDI